MSIVFLLALIVVIPQFASAQNITSENTTSRQPMENRSSSTSTSTSTSAGEIAIPQPAQVIVSPAVSIFWSQGGTTELRLQYLINTDNNIAIQPSDYSLQYYSPSSIEAGDLIEIGLRQPEDTTANTELIGVTVTPLTLDQFGIITGTVGNKTITLEEAAKDRYALDVEEGIYAINVYVRLNDANMVAVYSSPIEVGAIEEGT